MIDYIYTNGVSTPSGAYVLVQVNHEKSGVIPGNLFADYKFDNETQGFGTDWVTISICYHEKEKVVYAVGGSGEIIRISETDNTVEYISAKGAMVEYITEIKIINDDIYVVGMGYQIFKRTKNGIWEQVDNDVLKSNEEVSGFTSISGDNKLLIAVGYQGVIFECKKAWKKINSPTNLLLNSVVMHNDKYYAGGIKGTLLYKEEEEWKIIETPDFNFDIWDIESFQNTLYIGTTQGLFFLTDKNRIKPVNSAEFTQQIKCTKLSAGFGRLWCFGSKIVSMKDESFWREEKILSENKST